MATKAIFCRLLICGKRWVNINFDSIVIKYFRERFQESHQYTKEFGIACLSRCFHPWYVLNTWHVYGSNTSTQKFGIIQLVLLPFSLHCSEADATCTLALESATDGSFCVIPLVKFLNSKEKKGILSDGSVFPMKKTIKWRHRVAADDAVQSNF